MERCFTVSAFTVVLANAAKPNIFAVIYFI